MNSRERVIKALSRETPDRVPVDLSWGLTPPVYEKFKQITGQTDYEKYFQIDTRHIFLQGSRNKADFSQYFSNLSESDSLEIDEWGIGYTKSINKDLHFRKIASPLKRSRSVNDIMDFPLPDILEKYRWANIDSKVTAVQAEGLAACAPLATTLFEMAWQIRGFTEFVTDMIEQPDMAECLLDRLLKLRVEMTKRYVSSGIDVLMLGDDVAMQTGMLISPSLWREWFKPRMAKIIAAARVINPHILVFYHSDGNPSEIIEDLIDIGVNILNPVQPECLDPAAVKLKYGDRLAFWGTIGIQSTLPFGTPAEVRNEVKLRIRTVGKDGGLLLGPSHMIEPEVPWENLVALFEAIEEYGYYK